MAEDFNKKVTLIEVEVDNSQAQKAVDQLTGSILSQQNAVKANNDEIRALNKANKDLQKEVDKGTKSQDEANKQIQENSERAFKLQKTNANLKDGIKDLNKERQSAVKATKLQSNSLDALRNKSIELKKQLNSQETATAKGRKEFDRLSKQLEETNNQIRDLDKGAGDFKTNVGNYPDLLGGVTDGLDTMTGGMGGAIQSFGSMTKAALAFIATPIGAVLAAIVAAFLLVKNAMDRNEESANKIKKAFSAFEGIINFVLKALEPLGEYLIEGIVKGFELAAEAAEKAGKILSGSLKFLGFDEAAESVTKFNEEIKEAVKQSAELADMLAELQKAEREAAKLQLDFQKEAEKLRQIRDDEALSIETRIKANEELGRVLKNQQEEELKIAQLRLDTVSKQIELEGETTELLDLRAEALTEIADIQERITGQESEQLVNRNSLLKEANELELQALEQKRTREKEAHEAEIEAIKERIQEKGEIKEEERANFLARMDEFLEEQNIRLESQQEQADERAQQDIDREKAKAAEIMKIQGSLTQGISAGLDAANNIVSLKYKKRFADLDAQYKAGEITEAQYLRRKSKMEKDSALEAYKIERKRFFADKALKLVEIIVNTAVAMSKTAGQLGFPAAIPFMALAGALGTAQTIAVATQQPPPPPQFAEGGDVLALTVGGNLHSQGGTKYHGEDGNVFEVERDEGIFVTKRSATNPALALLDQANTENGGRSMFSSSSRFLQEGGNVSQAASEAQIARAVSEAVAKMPPPVVQVESIMGGINAESESLNVGVI